MVDAKVLGQLLLMQSVLNNLPDKKSIFSFVCKGLLDIPGIAKADYYEVSGDEYAKLPMQVCFPIVLDDSYFGELILSLSDTVIFKPYEDYLNNFVFMIGVILEERKQRHLNVQHQQLLEQRILERTQELIFEKENLIESQRRFTDLMKNVKLLSVMLDVNGNIIFCNRYLLSLTRYSAKEIMGKNWFDLFIPTENIEKIKQIFHDVKNGSELPYNYENEIITKNGKKLLISWNNTILRDASQKITGTASIGENITQRKRAEEALIKKSNDYKALSQEYKMINIELKKSLERLQIFNVQLEEAKGKAEESDRLKTAFLQNMSHEIRTPLNAIMGFSDLLPQNFNDKEKLKKFTSIIKQRGSDLLEIISDILDISKIESGQLPVHLEECNLNLLFSEIETFFIEYSERMNKQHVEFYLNLHCDFINKLVVIDRIKLKQILINLISNAIKFTHSGKIELGCDVYEDNSLTFYVADTGIGIPEDKKTKIFERFIQADTDTSLTYGGTGLGLSIVNGLLSLLGGKIWLETELGRGSTFYFTLPYRISENITHIVPRESKKELLVDSKFTILIVEDDLYNGAYLREILAETNYKIIYTKYGKDSVDIATNQDIDLILMDIRLPDITGYEAIRLIKKQKPGLKIVAQTAYASLPDRQKAIEAGCIDYLSKPITKVKLFELITNLIDK